MEVHYNETSEADGENEKKCPISSKYDRKRAATRNETKNTITFAGTTNEYSESDSDEKN